MAEPSERDELIAAYAANGELAKRAEDAERDLARMMPDDTSVLVPVASLSALTRRAEQAEAALRVIVNIGCQPYAGMGGESRRELRSRGQRMIDVATAALPP